MSLLVIYVPIVNNQEVTGCTHKWKEGYDDNRFAVPTREIGNDTKRNLETLGIGNDPKSTSVTLSHVIPFLHTHMIVSKYNK